MKHIFSTLILLTALACCAVITSSCSTDDAEDDNRCFTVKVLVVDNDVVYGEIEQVPEKNVLTESDQDIHVFPGQRITFHKKDIGYQVDEGDLIDIKLISYELYEGYHNMLHATPIKALKVKPCK